MLLRSYADLTPQKVAFFGFDDPTAAARILQELAGNEISDERFEQLLPALAEGLRATGDPDRALANLSHWLGKVGNRSSYYALLTNNPAALNALLAIFSVSQFFSDLLIKYPEHFEVVINPVIRDVPRDADAFYRDATLRMRVAKTPGAKRDALRRFKPPEILRIGARDILGIMGTEQIATEISDFAEACARAAVDIAEGQDGFAVIALGKLGGRELNYASDIDLVYVHSDEMPQARALELAESVTDALAKVTDAGFLFRVDLRLRPEGRFGPISRSIESCRAYYESWAEPWERQALLKARQVGGDPAVGAAFLEVAEQFVYRRAVDQEFVESIKENKRRIERKVQREQEADCNIKEGIGGIRDVEFIVQLMQLMAGGALPDVRSGATMDSLRRLAAAGLITETERDELGESYLFMRNLEHRLQIMDERPIRDLPLGDPKALTKFARRLKYESAEEFLRDFREHSARNNAYLQRLFYVQGAESKADSPQRTDEDALRILDAVRELIDSPESEELLEFLRANGFVEPEQALRILERRVAGTEYGEVHPEARERFIELAPQLLTLSAASGYPDEALRGIDSLATVVPSSAAFFRSLLDSHLLLERLTCLAGAAPALWREGIVQHPELLDRLADEELVEEPSALQLGGKGPISAKLVAAYIRRERLRIAALDLWGLAGPEALMRQTTDIADQALLAALDNSLREEGFLQGLTGPSAQIPALFGLGKLGGRELSYSSDWDVLWIAPDHADTAQVKRIAERAMAFLSTAVKAQGETVEVDARLRPEGRFGTLARTISDYKQYFETSADIWERQVLLKARPIGGDRLLGERFMREAAEIVYDHPPDEEALAEIRHLKGRMERERAKSPDDLKLSPGGLSDIEWTVQLLQWRSGKRWVKAQTPNTLAAMKALRDSAVLRQDDWEILTTTYLELYTLRNRTWLRDGRSGDTPKEQPAELIEKRKQVRAIFERLFMF